MINKPIHFDISPSCDIRFESDRDRNLIIAQAISRFVSLAGRPNANDYATLEINNADNSQRIAGILAKPRSYRPPRDGKDEEVGWAVAIITPHEYDYICNLPEDEIDNALTSLLCLEGDKARYWTDRY